MYGTEKQIKYAEEIIFRAYEHVNAMIEHFEEEKETCSGKWDEMYNDVVVAAEHVKDWIDNCVNRVDDAWMWIKMKNMFSVPELNRKINKYIRIISTKRNSMEMIEIDVYYKP